MAIVVPVTAISGLLGLHKYRDRENTLNDVINPRKCKHPVYDHVKRMLYRSNFYATFCQAPKITHQLRVRARSLIDEACEQAGIRFNRPYAYFLKQRGLYQEKLNTDRCEKLFAHPIVDRQKKIERQYPGFVVRGSVDGCSDTHVYEIKTRATFLNIREWEKIQLAWYCHMTRMPGRLVAFLGNQHITWECTVRQADDMVKPHVDELTELLVHGNLNTPCLITCGA